MAQSYEFYLKHWSELEANVAADPELAFLEPKRAELAAEEKGLREALDRQAARKVEMHEATRELEGRVARGNRLMVQIHDLIRGHYGREAEKLGLFRLQPRRSKVLAAAMRKARKASKEEEEPSGNGQSPTQTAHSQTESTS